MWPVNDKSNNEINDQQNDCSGEYISSISSILQQLPTCLLPIAGHMKVDIINILLSTLAHQPIKRFINNNRKMIYCLHIHTSKKSCSANCSVSYNLEYWHCLHNSLHTL